MSLHGAKPENYVITINLSAMETSNLTKVRSTLKFRVETWTLSLTLNEEHKLLAFESRVSKIFVGYTYERLNEKYMLHNEKIRD